MIEYILSDFWEGTLKQEVCTILDESCSLLNFILFWTNWSKSSILVSDSG
jgi:hypothetical protein